MPEFLSNPEMICPSNVPIGEDIGEVQHFGL